MTDPITTARQAAFDSLCRAAEALGCAAVPAQNAIRFRADGKGGELASPFPMAAGLDPKTVADACGKGNWFEAIRPSGGWIAFDLSDDWRDYVRAWEGKLTLSTLAAPPIPDFPARIHPKSWLFSVLLGQCDPMSAARLDLGNPWQRMDRARRLASQRQGNNRPDRKLVNLAALCCGGDAAALLKLADAYLSHPGEDRMVLKYLTLGGEILGI